MGGVKNTYEENGDDTKINTQVHAILIYYFWFSLRIQLSGTVEYIWKYTEKDYRLTKDKSLKFIRRGEERKNSRFQTLVQQTRNFRISTQIWVHVIQDKKLELSQNFESPTHSVGGAIDENFRNLKNEKRMNFKIFCQFLSPHKA